MSSRMRFESHLFPDEPLGSLSRRAISGLRPESVTDIYTIIVVTGNDVENFHKDNIHI